MEIRIINSNITIEDLKTVAADQFGSLIKATVDIQIGSMALGGELHADEEQLLLEHGSSQNDLWGINLYSEQYV